MSNKIPIIKIPLDYIQGLRYIDDEFFSLALDDQCRCCEEILRPILKRPKLKVRRVQTQRYYSNPGTHSVRLDILAEEENGALCNVEIQRMPEGSEPKRGRYYGASIDVSVHRKGVEYSKLPDVYIIFIAEGDPYGENLPIYHVDKRIREIGEPYDDGMNVLYVNGAYNGNDDLGHLMHDLKCRNPGEMHNANLAARMKELKETPEGVAIVSEGLHALIEEGRRDLSHIIAEQKEEIAEQQKAAEKKDKELAERKEEIAAQRKAIAERDKKIEAMQKAMMENGLEVRDFI